MIDYRKEDVTKLNERYDVILDLSGKLPFEKAKAILKPRGTFINVSATPAAIFSSLLGNPFRGKKHKILLSKARSEDLKAIASFIDDGSLLPPPVQVFPFEKFGEAYRISESGNVIGKIVLQIRD